MYSAFREATSGLEELIAKLLNCKIVLGSLMKEREKDRVRQRQRQRVRKVSERAGLGIRKPLSYVNDFVIFIRSINIYRALFRARH